MKKIFLVLLFGFLFSSNTFAETKVIDVFKYKSSDKTVLLSVYTLCIDGYKFITSQDIAYAGYSNTMSISTSVGTIQFFEVVDGKSLPKRC